MFKGTTNRFILIHMTEEIIEEGSKESSID